MTKITTPIEYAKAACDTIMQKFSAEELPIVGKFHYHQGVFLSGMEMTYLECGEEKYNQYIKRWVDSIINSDGVITNYDSETLDDLQPGILLYRLSETTNDARYEKAIQAIKKDFDVYEKNKYGGFSHKKGRCTGQMWLDGFYMGSPFLAMYGKKYNDMSCFDVIYTQMRLMWEHCRDEKTGLLYHAWDSLKTAAWADRESGCAPCFWGRAMGWYVVALCNILDYAPADWEHRAEFISNIRECAAALAKYADEGTGCWYQVLDRTDDPENWIELSCSSLFTYFLSMAICRGYIDEKLYAPVVKKAYSGILGFIKTNPDGTVDVPRVCIGTGVGDYRFYLDRPTVTNDLHGAGAFVLCCNAYNEFQKHENACIGGKTDETQFKDVDCSYVDCGCCV